MSRPAVAIPEKLFFKIGEVCELAGVQAHVLRYWESEFPMLAPQKNRAGQRVYRKRDVEMALRIKELLYEDQYTIAGAKKRLTNELRGGGKLKVVGAEEDGQAESAPVEFNEGELFTATTDYLHAHRRATHCGRETGIEATRVRVARIACAARAGNKAKEPQHEVNDVLFRSLTFVLWQDTKSGTRDVAQPGSAHAWGA